VNLDYLVNGLVGGAVTVYLMFVLVRAEKL
jgi:hypothetical protein